MSDEEPQEQDRQSTRTPRRPSASPQRVRFSTDTQGERRTKKRKSDDAPTYAPERGDRAGPALSLNIEAARNSYHRPSTDDGRVKSPVEVTSPSAVRSPVLSPKARTRGMSLRSSLFMRNMNQKPPTERGAIELQTVITPSDDDEDDLDPREPSKRTRISIAELPPDESSRSNTPSQGGKKSLLGTPALPNYQRWAQKQARRHLPMTKMQAWYKSAHDFLLRVQEIPPTKDGRHIPFDPSRKTPLVDERTGRPYLSNLIRSSKYTPFNFVPRQLFAQFGKLANFYFLIVSILQMIPGLR